MSIDEIALYDRQIRLWGMAAQANMRSSSVLLINLGAIGNEVAKNIVLSGIGSLTILDSNVITEEDLGSQFFIGKEDVGTKRLDAARPHIEDMNPRVKLSIDTDNVLSKDTEYFSQFSLIVATDLTPVEIKELNKKTRDVKVPLYAAGINGFSGYIFADLIQFLSVDEKLKSARPVELGQTSPNKVIVELDERKDEGKNVVYQVITTKHTFKPLDELLHSAILTNQLSRRQLKRMTPKVPLTLTLLKQDTKYDSLDLESFHSQYHSTCKQLGLQIEEVSTETIKQFIDQISVELSPVAAVIGGALSQDVINVLGKRQSPLNNFVVFDGVTLDMWVFEL